MHNKFKFFITTLTVIILTALTSCDPHHTDEFYKINRSDIEGYELFIEKYPDSKFVKDARERIATEKENRRIAEI